MRVLDLFSGIGGFSLGLERAGHQTVAFCEIDPFCRRVLKKHWPNVPIFGDIRKLAVDEGWLVSHTNQRCEPTQEQLQSRGQRIRADSIDVICGGFPCQDISVAGKGAGIEGSRSGLWSEYARIIGEVRPRYVIVENVAALLGRGVERVLGDLAALGFDAEWHCIPASAVGAPHRRDRVWIVGHAGSEGLQGCFRSGDLEVQGTEEQIRPTWQTSPSISDTERNGIGAGLCDALADGIGRRRLGDRDWWLIEPNVGRVAHGVPSRVDRLRSLGNAVVPQIPEIIGKALTCR